MTVPLSCKVWPFKNHLDMKRSILRWPAWQNSAAISTHLNKYSKQWILQPINTCCA